MEPGKTYDIKKAVWYSIAVMFAFTLLTYGLSMTLGGFRETLLPDQGASWYYWKLPHPERWATLSMWVLYGAHQGLVWWLIYRLKKAPPVPRGRIGRVNAHLLLVNTAFVGLHLLQTVFFYDALAQFVPVMSSQGSVILMLVMILMMLNRRRGLFFGKKAGLPQQGVAWVSKIHGYYIAWAVIYTFWFHPMEGTAGHLMGFFYLFMLMTQISLARTSWHTNLKWITYLEVFVALHGAVVAIEARNGMWPMFFFGFMLVFIVTQVYGLIRNRLAIAGITASYAAMVLMTYGGLFGSDFSGKAAGLGSIHQITWIPVILYGLVFGIAWFAQGAIHLARRGR